MIRNKVHTTVLLVYGMILYNLQVIATYNGYITTKDVVIDHIYCSNYLEVVEYHTINENYGVPFVSDHYPIYAIIKLK